MLLRHFFTHQSKLIMLMLIAVINLSAAGFYRHYKTQITQVVETVSSQSNEVNNTLLAEHELQFVQHANWLTLTINTSAGKVTPTNVMANYWLLLALVNVLLVSMLALRMLTLRVRDDVAAKPLLPKLTTTDQTTFEINQALLGTKLKSSNSDQLFALIESSRLESAYDYCRRVLAAELNHASVSLKKINDHRMTLTLAASEGEDKRCHGVLRQIANSQYNCKIGYCHYHGEVKQLYVYQLAEAALAVVKAKPRVQIHAIEYNSTNIGLFNLAVDELLEYIKQKQFFILFQPVFSLYNDSILQHEALLRVRHEELGVLNGRQFFCQIYGVEQQREIDFAIVENIVATLAYEKQIEQVSINLSAAIWLDTNALKKVISMVHKVSCQFVFELSEKDYVFYIKELDESLKLIKQNGLSVMIDKVEHALMHADLHPVVKAIKFSTELVHGIEQNITQQEQIKQLCRYAKINGLQVYASGVETASELQFLKRFPILGAQGYYFSKPLQQFALFKQN